LTLTRRNFTNVSTEALSIRPDLSPSLKRNKAMGLNSRFNRMLERVDLTLQDLQVPSTTASLRSTASSSISSGSEIPRTPVDAYNELQNERLGHTFSVIKMKSSGARKIGPYYTAHSTYDRDSGMQPEEHDEVVSFKLPSDLR
jgi:hypothetical protein